MKKGLALLITAFMTMSGTACGSSDAQTPHRTKTKRSSPKMQTKQSLRAGQKNIYNFLS